MLMRLHLILSVAIIVLVLPVTLFAAEKNLTIVHTNDMHSHFLGVPSNIEYTPFKTGDDKTLGGWARIASVIKKVRRDRKHPVLVLDGGDFLMGSLFHTYAHPGRGV